MVGESVLSGLFPGEKRNREEGETELVQMNNL